MTDTLNLIKKLTYDEQEDDDNQSTTSSCCSVGQTTSTTTTTTKTAEAAAATIQQKSEADTTIEEYSSILTSSPDHDDQTKATFAKPPVVLLSSLKKKPLQSEMTNTEDSAIKKSVKFSRVNVFLFERTQGYNCVPSDAGAVASTVTLGMSPRHSIKEEYDIEHFKQCKRLYHLSKLEEEKEKIIEDIKATIQIGELCSFDEHEQQQQQGAKSAKKAKKTLAKQQHVDGDEEPPPPPPKPLSAQLSEIKDEQELDRRVREAIEKRELTADLLKDEDRLILDILDNRAIYENADVELPINMEIFLPAYSSDERKELLLKAGVEELDEEVESKEIEDIRESRQFCGCNCKQNNMLCDQETCSCFANGISCQLDKVRFPCACTIKRCQNPFGNKRFDQKAVLKHYQKVLIDDVPITTTTLTNQLTKEEENNDDHAATTTTTTTSSLNANKRQASATDADEVEEVTSAVAITTETVVAEAAAAAAATVELASYPLSPKPKRPRKSLIVNKIKIPSSAIKIPSSKTKSTTTTAASETK